MFENRWIVRTTADGSTINISYDADGNRIDTALAQGRSAAMWGTNGIVGGSQFGP